MKHLPCLMVLCVLSLLYFSQEVQASPTDGCVSRYRYVAPVAYQQTYSAYGPSYYYAQQLVAQYVAVPVPVYSLGYAPGADTQQLKLEIELLKLKNEVLQQRQRIEQLQAPKPQEQINPPQQPPIPPQQVSKGAQLLVQRCGSCHEQSVAKAKGDGIVLMTGQNIVPLKGDLGFALVKALYKGSMPKNSKLTDQEVGEIMAFIDKAP